MIPYSLGDILLLKAFPFSHLGAVKKRPAVVLADVGNDDLLVARVTSEAARDDFDLVIARWKEAGLLLPSVVRLSKMATLHKRLIVRRMGKLGFPERRKIREIIKRLFDLF